MVIIGLTLTAIGRILPSHISQGLQEHSPFFIFPFLGPFALIEALLSREGSILVEGFFCPCFAWLPS
jgi:hypothetical protein